MQECRHKGGKQEPKQGRRNKPWCIRLLTNLVIKIKNKVIERASMVRKKKKQRTRVVIQEKM